eukprot:11224889-Alexandrium_andersonii.AAC.1
MSERERGVPLHALPTETRLSHPASRTRLQNRTTATTETQLSRPTSQYRAQHREHAGMCVTCIDARPPA